jgi:hypothetical protein
MNYVPQNISLQNEAFTIGQDSGLVIPLPALLVRWFVPAVGNTRTWTRFGQFAIFGLTILAAYGAAAWHAREISRPRGWRNKKRQDRRPKTEDQELKGRQPHIPHLRSSWPWLLVIGLALFEVWWKPMPTHPPSTQRPVDVWLRQQPAQEAIIQYPLESSFNGSQFIYTQAHGKPIVHGYGNPFGFMFGRRHPELLTFPDAVSLAALSRWPVRYVLIETEGPGTQDAEQLLKKVAAVPCLHPATVQDSIHVFELVGCAQAH